MYRNRDSNRNNGTGSSSGSSKKEKEKHILDTIDTAINELVYEKTQIIKAYNYYHAKRDPEQFRHLEENYGIGTPTSVEFTPLTRKHIDVLVGEYLSTPVLPRVSCKDSRTISNIFRDKQNKINSEIAKALNTHLRNTLYASILGQPGVPDKAIQQQLTDLYESIDRNFISEYEIAGQNIIDWAMQSRAIDFANQRKIMLIDLLVSGTVYYKVCPSPSQTNLTLRVLNPINTFVDRNPASPYLKDSSRAVIRSYLTKQQILAKYGKFLTEEDLSELDKLSDYSIDGSATTYLRSYDYVVGDTVSDGILGGFEVTPLLPSERSTSQSFRVFPVYEVEWLETEKEGDEYIVNRYEGTRIGTNIYLPTGKVENVVRSIDDPLNCALSVNGIFFSDRNGDPLSLILMTANLQDKNDILSFYRDNIISESGTTGDWLDVAHLPAFLGADVTERLMKWKAYKKSGIALIDSSQEGTPMVNTTFGGYDDTIKLEAIQAIDLAIQRIEEQCSMITGVFRERLGGIEQKDAVANVQTGVRQSTYITKQYYQVMDLVTREILIDILNTAKIVYKNGISGTLILGEKLNRIFTALPEHYTTTDFDINIADSADIVKEQETIKELSIQLVKGNLLDPETLLELITAKSLTRMKEDVKASLDKKKQENDELGKLTQEIKQLQQQLQQTSTEAKRLQQQVQKLNADKLEIEREKIQAKNELEWYKAKNENRFNESRLDFDKKKTQLEAVELLNNKYNNKIKPDPYDIYTRDKS